MIHDFSDIIISFFLHSCLERDLKTIVSLCLSHCTVTLFMFKILSLITQIMGLKNREQTESINLNKETEGSCSNRSDNSSDNLRLDISTAPPSNDSTLTGGHPPPPQTVGRHFFPPSPATATTTTTTMQFFQNSSSGQSMVKEENSISNMFCAMDDHSGFWPWLDQQQYN